MKKSIKYAGIMSAVLMVLSPIAVPTIHVVRADATEETPDTIKSINMTIPDTIYVDPGTTLVDLMGGADGTGTSYESFPVTINIIDTLSSAVGIKDDQGNDIKGNITGQINSGSIYESLDDALNGKNGIDADTIDYNVDEEAKDGDIYYIAVSLDLSDSSNPDGQMAKAFESYLKDPSSVDLNINGQKFEPSSKYNDRYGLNVFLNGIKISYITKVIVGTKPTTPDNTNTNHTTKPATPKKGIVTTHTDQSSYSLYDENNEKIDNRALVANSSWKMDGTRTVGGIKQYRVSTDEWVNASDVDFVENGKVTEGMTVQNLDTPKEITLSNRHARYNLQDSNKVVSTTRALAGGTSWLVDKIGTDMHGGIYYGVSTNEFVKADDGVIISK